MKKHTILKHTIVLKHVKKALALALVFALLAVGTAGCKQNDAAGASGGTEEGTGQAEAEQTTEPVADAAADTKAEGSDDLSAADATADGIVEDLDDDEYLYDENGTPLTEEEIEDIYGGDPSVGMPVPFVEYLDYDEFLKNSEIEVEAPTSLPITVEYVSYLLYNDGMYELRYEDEQGSQVSFRKGYGSEDNSGVYLDFDKKEIIEINGRDVKFASANGKCLLATWTDGSFAYSVYADSGCDLEKMKETVSSVKPAAN